MRKIYPTFFSKFAVFILYGLLLVAVITLARPQNGQNGQGQGNGESGGEGTGATGATEGTAGASNQPSPKIFPVSNGKCPPTLPSGNQIIIGYVQRNINPTTIRWDYYNYINVIAPSGPASFNPSDMNFLNTFVSNKKSSAKILLSIRNFDPSTWPTDESYRVLADNLINTITTYNLDGVDIEYPGMRGRYCGAWDTTKDPSFVNFLTYLYNGTKQNKKILMLTGGNDAIGGFDARIIGIDILNIETFHYSFYDNYIVNPQPDGKVKTGSNAPFNAYTAAHDKWRVTGIDDSKIAMGVDLGNTFQIVDNQGITKQQTVQTGTSDTGTNGNDYNNLTPITFCPNNNDKLKNIYSFPWRQLFEDKILNPSGDTQCYPKVDSSWQYHFDSTSWLTKPIQNSQNPKLFYYISYEDFTSLNNKLNSTLGKSIGGISISDISYDTNDNYSLVNYMQYIRNGQSTSPTPTDPGSSASSIPQGNSSTTSVGGDGNTASPVASTNDNQNEGNRKAGKIAGAVIGSILGVAIMGGIAFFGYKNRDKLPFGQNQYSKNMYNQGTTYMNQQPGMIIPNNSPRMVLPDTAAIPVAPSYVTAMFDFIGKEENDLSFKKGDKIEVLERGDGPNDWWVGRVNGAVGEFPGNYVKE